MGSPRAPLGSAVASGFRAGEAAAAREPSPPSAAAAAAGLWSGSTGSRMMDLRDELAEEMAVAKRLRPEPEPEPEPERVSTAREEAAARDGSDAAAPAEADAAAPAGGEVLLPVAAATAAAAAAPLPAAELAVPAAAAPGLRVGAAAPAAAGPVVPALGDEEGCGLVAAFVAVAGIDAADAVAEAVVVVEAAGASAALAAVPAEDSSMHGPPMLSRSAGSCSGLTRTAATAAGWEAAAVEALPAAEAGWEMRGAVCDRLLTGPSAPTPA